MNLKQIENLKIKKDRLFINIEKNLDANKKLENMILMINNKLNQICNHEWVMNDLDNTSYFCKYCELRKST